MCQPGTVTPMSGDKRAALVEAAEAVFVERGIARATVDEITARAGVAKGTFYLYFSSKEELVRALHEQLWEGHVALTREAAERMLTMGLWPAVDEFIERVVDYDLEHLAWHRLVAQTWSQPLEQGKAEQEILALVTAAIQLGIEAGEFHADDPELTATLLYRAMQGTSHQYCTTEEEPDRDRLVAAVRSLVHRVLEPPS
jgi:AcrR family transcriptional regulator